MTNISPHNIQAEQSVLGAILLSGKEIILKALKDLSPEGTDFYHDVHGRIFKAMVEIDNEGSPVELVTLAEKLEGSKALDSMGGLSYIAELLEASPTSANAGYHIKIVKEASVRRQTIRSLTNACTDLYDKDKDMSNVLSGLSSSLVLQSSTSLEPYHAFKDLLGVQFNLLDEFIDNKGGLDIGLKTGFMPLDNAIGGFVGGELIVIAGRPSMGKSALVNNIVLNVTEEDKKVFVFSLEVGKEQYTRNLISIVAKINTMKWRTANIVEEDLTLISKHFNEMAARNIYVDDSSNDIDRIVTQANLMALEVGAPDLILLDHIQEATKGSYKGYSRKEEIDLILSDFRRLGRTYGCPAISVQQLNRKCEERADKRPIKSDLQDSGGGEQKADMILFVHREAVYDKEISPDMENICEIIIAKMRNGNTGTVELYFDKAYTKFKDDPIYLGGGGYA